MMPLVDPNAVLSQASVPEHSALFMRAMSGGEPLIEGSYLFFAADDWLLAVGYPLEGEYEAVSFDYALAQALKRTRASDCWAIAPVLPERLQPHRREEDRYYLLSTEAAVPDRLERLAARASSRLHVENGALFSPAHRRLWAEFTGRVALPARVRELFARTEDVIASVPGLSLLNAWDANGNLAACLMIDSAPHRFSSYLLGAHSRTHYHPHASDLLFLEMIAMARQAGKEFIHLGLGVNPGIRRFKTKWGGRPGLRYEMAEWQVPAGPRAEIGEMMGMLATMPPGGLSKREYFASLPAQRRFRMLWEVEKNGCRSWIGGTAHFFCFSFDTSLRELFEKVDTVLFEGPLDPASLAEVAQIGREPAADSPRLIDLLSAEEIGRLERVVCGPKGFWARLFGYQEAAPPDVTGLLSQTRHWMAFFSLWTGYLRRQGWTQSVDLEAWQLAREMGKAVRGMETIAEQIETLENIPVPRIVRFLRGCRGWDAIARRNVKAYLTGDLEALMGTSAEFPTRTELVIHRRDARFLQRMRPAIEQGRCAVFVGSAHMLNLRQMLAEQGFSVRRCG